MSIVMALKERPPDSPEENGRRIAAVLVVIYCLEKLIPHQLKREDINLDTVADMMFMLTLKPDTKNQKCIDYEYVLSLLHSNSTRPVGEAIRAFCNHLSHHRDLQAPQWLYAIPIYHFLHGDCKPFSSPQLDPNMMKWGDKNLGLQHVRKRTFDKVHFKYVLELVLNDNLDAV